MQRILRPYLVFVFFLYTAIIFHFVLNQPIWSPIDEIGHYDYVDQLSSGHIPAPNQPISDYTASLTLQRFEWIHGADFQGTKETMGQAGYSYEAQQPPLYYLLLALPNYGLKTARVDPTLQIQTLRLINALFEIFGAVAGGLVVFRLRRFIPFSALWAWVIPILLLIPNWYWRSSLGNGNLSLWMVNLAFFFALGSFSDLSRQRYSTLALLFGALAFLTKYTNILALAGVLVLWLVGEILWVRRSAAGFSVKRAAASLWPLGLILVYLAANVARFGWDGPLGSKGVSQLFSYITIEVWGLSFFVQLFRTAYLVNFLPFVLPVLPGITAGGLATAVLALVYLYRRALAPALAWFFMLGMLAGLAVFAWLLTKVAPTVDWGFFRHYSGYLLLIVLVSFGAFLRAGIVEKISIPLISAALAVPALYYIINLF